MSALVSGRLLEVGFAMPEPPAALGAYVPAVRAGDLVFTSGQLPMRDGALLVSGLVGAEVTVDTARMAAEQAALNALAAAATVCDLDAVARVVRMTGFVACAPGFTSQPAVVDGASHVIKVAFPEVEGHARLAVGVASLPLDAPVEVEIVLALRTGA